MRRINQHQRSSTIQISHLDILGQLRYERQFGMPVIDAYQSEVPKCLIRWDEAMRASMCSCTPHFYIYDELFTAIVRTPDRYLPIIKRFPSIIGPDFSQYVNMPKPVRMYNAFLNKAITAFWQQNGINVIPNVTWSTPDSYDYSFAGLPQNSVVSINCNGIRAHSSSQYLWIKGYKEALNRLKPSCIIRYGDRMIEENVDISVYFPNEQIEKARCASKSCGKTRKENKIMNQLKIM